MDYKRIYEEIMNSDPNIRLVTICDLKGKIMYSDHRQGVKNLLTPEESKKSLELAVNAWKTRSTLAPPKNSIIPLLSFLSKNDSSVPFPGFLSYRYVLKAQPMENPRVTTVRIIRDTINSIDDG